MPDRIEEADKSIAGWRVIASAWIIAVIFIATFATVQALASLHNVSSRSDHLVGAVIPRHDASVPGPDEVAESDQLERARAEAYSGW
jgi:hypothetical protein